VENVLSINKCQVGIPIRVRIAERFEHVTLVYGGKTREEYDASMSKLRKKVSPTLKEVRVVEAKEREYKKLEAFDRELLITRFRTIVQDLSNGDLELLINDIQSVIKPNQITL
jgi:hypothetical protein